MVSCLFSTPAGYITPGTKLKKKTLNANALRVREEGGHPA